MPQIWAILLLIPQLALYGNELFTSHKPVIEGSVLYSSLYLIFGIIEAAAGIWAFILLLNSLGQAQGFSAWKALINVLLTILVMVLPLMLLAFGVAFIIR